MLKIKKTINSLRKNLFKMKRFLIRHRLIMSVIVIPVVVMSITLYTYDKVWRPSILPLTLPRPYFNIPEISPYFSINNPSINININITNEIKIKIR
jgi:hypothetical protein